MANASKIIWSEGLFLHPHLFQYQDRFHEDRLWSSLRSLHAYPWGLAHLSASNMGDDLEQFDITALDAVLPDGTIVSAPALDDLPAPLRLTDIDATVTAIYVCVDLPPWNHEGGNCPDKPQASARYGSRIAQVPDQFGSIEPAPLRFARAQPRLRPMFDANGDPNMLTIGRLLRTANGRFRFDNCFIAPVVNARHSPALEARLVAHQQAIIGRITALEGGQAENVREAVAFRAGESATFWLLQALNAAVTSLAHLMALPVVAPERLFQELLRLAGNLLAFSRTVRHSDLPAYDHARADESFATLFAKLGKLIDTVIPVRFTAVPLTKVRASHYSAALGEPPADSSTYYLTVSGTQPPQELMVEVPARFKVGAPEEVTRAVASAVRCIPLTHVHQPPAGVPVKPGHLYFVLDGRDPAFARMRAVGEIAAFAPAGLDGATLELLIVSD